MITSLTTYNSEEEADDDFTFPLTLKTKSKPNSGANTPTLPESVNGAD
jgi:glycogen(starch) synthase